MKHQQTRNFLPLHSEDVSESEIVITNRLIELISDENIEYFDKRKFQCLHTKKDIVTIGINGIPYNKEQFQGFTFPGIFVNYIIPGLEPQGSEEFFLQRFKKIKKQQILIEMDEIVEKYGKGHVVLVYHSFGTYAATLYAVNYPQKVVGLVEFGAMPIYPSEHEKIFYHAQKYKNTKKIDLDEQWKLYLEQFQNTPFRMRLHNKYNNLARRLFLNEVLENAFYWRREMPKVLKFFALGRKDRVIQSSMINNTIAYYTYGKGKYLDDVYEKKLIEVYKKMTGDTVKNIRESFILSFPNTGHGVHIKRKKELQNALNLYFSLILQQLPLRSNL